MQELWVQLDDWAKNNIIRDYNFESIKKNLTSSQKSNVKRLQLEVKNKYQWERI